MRPSLILIYPGPSLIDDPAIHVTYSCAAVKNKRKCLISVDPPDAEAERDIHRDRLCVPRAVRRWRRALGFPDGRCFLGHCICVRYADARLVVVVTVYGHFGHSCRRNRVSLGLPVWRPDDLDLLIEQGIPSGPDALGPMVKWKAFPALSRPRGTNPIKARLILARGDVVTGCENGRSLAR